MRPWYSYIQSTYNKYALRKSMIIINKNRLRIDDVRAFYWKVGVETSDASFVLLLDTSLSQDRSFAHVPLLIYYIHLYNSYTQVSNSGKIRMYACNIIVPLRLNGHTSHGAECIYIVVSYTHTQPPHKLMHAHTHVAIRHGCFVFFFFYFDSHDLCVAISTGQLCVYACACVRKTRYVHGTYYSKYIVI